MSDFQLEEEEDDPTDIATVFDLQRYLLTLINQGHLNMHIYVQEGNKEYLALFTIDNGRLYISAGNPALLMME